MRTQVLVVGDSVSEGYGATELKNSWPAVFSRLVGGRGDGQEWLKPMYGHETFPVPVRRAGVVTEIYGRAIGREEATLGVGGSVTWEFTGTSCEVMYSIGSAAGVMSVRLDSEAPVLVDTSTPVSSGTIGSWRSPHLARGEHTVSVSRHESSGEGKFVFLHGVATYFGDEQQGLRVLNGARSGARSAQFVDTYSGARRSRWLGIDCQRLWGVDVVIIALGINDSRDSPPVAGGTFKNNVETLIADLRQYGFCGPVVLVSLYLTHPDNGDAAARAWYAAACDEIAADQLQVSHLDLRDRMPRIGTPEGDASGYYTDRLHPSDLGHARIAGLVAEHCQQHSVFARPAFGGIGKASLSLADGWLRVPNRGDTTAWPVVEVTTDDTPVTLTITHDSGVYSLSVPAWSKYTANFREGDVFTQKGARVFSRETGPRPAIPPGGAKWKIAGMGNAVGVVRRHEAWT